MKFIEFATRNVIRNIRAYFGYFLSSSISSALLFSFTMLILHPDMDISSFRNYLQVGFKLTMSIAYLFLCFFIFYSVSVFLKSRYKEIGILYTIGASNKQVKRMIIIENILISSLSGIVGVLIGLIFSKIFLLASGKLLGYGILGFYLPSKAIIITIIGFILMGGIISIFTTSIIKEDRVLALLKATKKPKNEPKSSKILTLICIILIVLGYYFSITSTMENIIYRIIPVTTIVVIGTYLLFSQFSVFMINKLRRNKVFYMNKTRLLWVSDLLYRVKDNTRMFFLITITSAVAFTSIGGVYSFWLNKESEVNASFPQTFFYAFNEESLDVDEKIAFLEGALNKSNYDYKMAKGNIKSLKYNDDEINIISEETYNKLAKSFVKEEIDLKENEGLLNSSLSNNVNNIEIDGENIKIISKLDSRVLPALYESIYVLNYESYDKIKALEFSFCSINVDNYKDTLDISRSYLKRFGEENYGKERVLLIKANLLESIKLGYGIFMFLAIFIGIIFFVTTASFLYNKYYMDIEEDKIRYSKLNKIGLTFKEIKKISTIEIGVLFLLPYIVAVIHSLFALLALNNAFDMKISISAITVMGSFFIIQVIYFLIIRKKYLIEIKRNL
ncbi:FtsX-like permease family protein [Clostridium sp. DSM 100503]|uniref:FtsX-like permease family protein n=1 Tax=Clostridium sp. DSM 100503 TaxID=2963282 RepID=UPI00214A86E1|nr:FtsX-like permease family protein [Clostridium sp. DSM 100503]MCR1950392.1 FtsX-like permease family protein [Clostridium sp. DSM 100503]